MTTDRFQIGGFTEAGISTTDPTGWISFLQAVGGWDLIWQGCSSAAQKRLWGIDEACAVNEWLLGRPEANNGHIRLFQFDITDPVEIRKGTQTCDPGGIFDLNIRVENIDPYVTELESRGWRGVSPPIGWTFMGLSVREWLTVGPDSVILALIERVAPPLEGWGRIEKFSRVFNSSQIVSSMDAALAFYEKLGFERLMRHQGPLEGNGGRVLGLSEAEAPTTAVDLSIVQPAGALDGSVELVKIEDVVGRHVGHLAQPWNLGMNLLRFPVTGFGSFVEHLKKEQLMPADNKIESMLLAPYGQTRMLALQSPDGAWLEFYDRPA
jgi:catechol 2,3-dioxygenase-like lactoylglutathione lyase family enzyme